MKALEAECAMREHELMLTYGDASHCRIPTASLVGIALLCHDVTFKSLVRCAEA